MSTRDYLTRLAGLAAGTRFDSLTAATVAAARDVTLDTLGAILAGSRLTENARLADLAAERSGSRAATLVGHGRKAEPMLAALANGTAGVALEMDEGNRLGGGHPAIHVIPGALAVAEERGIVMHAADYATPEFAAVHGRIGRSQERGSGAHAHRDHDRGRRAGGQRRHHRRNVVRSQPAAGEAGDRGHRHVEPGAGQQRGSLQHPRLVLAGRRVRTVNHLVAHVAPSAVHLVGARRSRQQETFVRRWRMSRRHVAALAEERYLGHEQALIIGPVWVVAAHAGHRAVEVAIAE